MATARRAWWLYAAGWLAVAAVYTAMISLTRGVAPRSAAISGVIYVVPPALLGVGVWWLTARLPLPSAHTARTLLVHVVCAVLYGALWSFTSVGWVVLRAGWVVGRAVANDVAGWQALTGVWAYAVIAGGSYALRATAHAARADAARVTAELHALRGQLNPHFLFNTLHTVTALVRRDPDSAERALEQLGGLLRYVLGVKRAGREDVTLAEELEFVRGYLALERLRLGDRLRVVERVDPEALDCMLPSLTLQPIIENAVKHGVAPRAGGGALTIAADLADDTLVVEVRDDGPGADADAARGAPGLGLRAVRQRLETRFRGAARFAVHSAPGAGFAVRLTIPATSSSGARA